MKEITNNDNKSTSINEINIDGKVVSDRKGISDALNDHFDSIGNKLAGEILVQSSHLQTICQKQARSVPDSYLREFSQNMYLIFSPN